MEKTKAPYLKINSELEYTIVIHFLFYKNFEFTSHIDHSGYLSLEQEFLILDRYRMRHIDKDFYICLEPNRGLCTHCGEMPSESTSYIYEEISNYFDFLKYAL